MGTKHLIAGTVALGMAVMLSACAGDSFVGGEGTTTSALPAKPKADAACAPLAAKIEELRKDGVAERVEKAAAGKGATVSVKRDSLVKLAELNKANAEFQAKCSTYVVAPGTKTATLSTGAGAPAASATKAASGAQKAAAGVGAAATKSATPPKKAAAKEEAPAQKTPPPVEDAGETKKE